MIENPYLWYFNHYTMTWNIWYYPIEGLKSLLYIQTFVRNFLTKIRNKPTDETSKGILECELPPEIVNDVLSYFEYTPEHKKINKKNS